MSDKDLFAPPSKEELNDIFSAPPSTEELKFIQTQPSKNLISDIAQSGMNVLRGVGAALDYPVAPLRSALTGQNPLTPLLKGPSAAPTSEQVLAQIPALKETTIPVAENLFPTPDFNKKISSPEELRQLLKISTKEQPLSEALAPALDVGLGAGALKGLGFAAKGIGAGTQMAGKVVPEAAKQAFQKGLQGIDVSSKEFYEQTGKKLQDIVRKVSKPILAKTEAQQAENAANIANLDNQIAGIQKKTQDAIKVGEMRQLAQNAEDIRAIDKSTVDAAKDLQKSLFDTKKALGEQYNKIDAAAEATGIVPENRDIIGNFLQEIELKSGLDEGKVKSIQKLLVPSFGQTDMQSFRNLKSTLNNLADYDNPIVKKAARQAYGELKGNFAKDLADGGYTDLANNLAETNKRWSAISSLEEDYISNLKPHRVTGEFEASPDTTKAIQTFLEKSPEQMAKSETMSKLLKVASPAAPETITKLGQLAEKSAEAKAFKPQVPELPNPELTRLQNLLQKAKGETPKEIPGLELPVSDKTALEEQLTTLLPKYEMRTSQDIAERKLGQTFDFLKGEIGEEAAGQIQKELKPLAKDLELRRAVSGSKQKLPTSIEGIVESVTGGLTKASGKAGLAVKSVQDVMRLGSKKLSTATPQEIVAFGQKMIQTDPAAKSYAKILSEAADKNKTSRDAIIYSLMQQPKFRELYKKTEGIEDETSGK